MACQSKSTVSCPIGVSLTTHSQNLLAQNHSANAKGLLALLHISAFHLLEEFYFFVYDLCLSLINMIEVSAENYEPDFLFWPIKIFSFPNNSSVVSHRQINSELPSLTCQTHGYLASPYLSKHISHHRQSPSASVRSCNSVHAYNIFSPHFTHVDPRRCNEFIFPSNDPWHFTSQHLLVSLCFTLLKNSVCTPQLNIS